MKKAMLLLLSAMFLWGIAIAPIKWVLESMGPITFLFLRLLIGSVLILPYTMWKNQIRISEVKIPWKPIIILSFSGVSGYYLLYTVGVDLTSALNASVLTAAIPLFTVLLAAFFLRERITRSQWVGLILGTMGVLLISIKSGEINNGSLLGDLFVLASCLLWGVYIIQLKRAEKTVKLPSGFFTALLIVVGAVMLAPFALMEIAYTGLPQWTLKSSLSLLYVAVPSTVLAYLFWNQALKSVSAATAGLTINFLPLIEVLTSIALLGEGLTVRVLLGGLLILSGVFWAERLWLLLPSKKIAKN